MIRSGGATPANFTSNNDNANAFILKDGTAKFQSISIGGTTTQYIIGNDGIFSFGDGSDGALTTSGDVTLTEDKYFTNLTISTGDTFKPDGFRIFVSGTLTLEGTGKISGNGNAGSGTSGGAALADGYLKGSLVGGDGGSTSADPGDNGVNTTNSLGSDGVDGGLGGRVGGVGGTGGTATASNVKLIANWHLSTLLDVATSGSTVKFDNSASAGGGGASGLNSGTFGNGGGAGSAGRILAIYAKIIVIGASASIIANGGDGGNGTTNGASNANGGGGGGGNGGQIILVFNQITNNGSLTVTGGVAGLKGQGAGGEGADGDAGTAGTIRQFNLSL